MVESPIPMRTTRSSSEPRSRGRMKVLIASGVIGLLLGVIYTIAFSIISPDLPGEFISNAAIGFALGAMVGHLLGSLRGLAASGRVTSIVLVGLAGLSGFFIGVNSAWVSSPLNPLRGSLYGIHDDQVFGFEVALLAATAMAWFAVRAEPAKEGNPNRIPNKANP